MRVVRVGRFLNDNVKKNRERTHRHISTHAQLRILNNSILGAYQYMFSIVPRIFI